MTAGRAPGLRDVRVALPDGAHLSVAVAGEGAPVLLLPALARDGRDFDPLAAALVQAGRRVLAVAPRGVGDSAPARPDSTLADHVEDAAAVLDALAPGDAADVIGATFGGRVARALAVRRPDLVRCLVLLGSGGTVPPDPDATAAARAFMTALAEGRAEGSLDAARVYFGPGADPAIEPLRSLFLDGWWPAGLAGQRAAARDSAGDGEILSGGAAPMLIVHGTADRIAPPANAEALAEAAGARARLVLVEGTGHLVMLDAPDAAVAAVTAFLAGA